MKVWRWVITEIHRDDDTQKSANLRHLGIYHGTGTLLSDRSHLVSNRLVLTYEMETRRVETYLFAWSVLLLFLLVSCNSEIVLPQNCQVNANRLMPSNLVPNGARIAKFTSAGSSVEVINFTTIDGDLNVDELLTHYDFQTAEQRDDWTLLQSGNDGSTAWSSWAVVDECDEQWDGLIMISKPPSTTDPFAVIRVKKRS